MNIRGVTQRNGHINLSALQIIGSSVLSLLGPTKSVKCLLDGESQEGVLVTNTNEVLQGLDIEHPVGQVVREFSLSQHKCHGSGCTTLVTLAGLWAANIQSLLAQGVSMQEIIRAGDEFFQECECVAEQCAISIRDLPISETIISKTEDNWLTLNQGLTSVASTSRCESHHHLDTAHSEGELKESIPYKNNNNNCSSASVKDYKSSVGSKYEGTKRYEFHNPSPRRDLKSSASSLVRSQFVTDASAISGKPNKTLSKNDCGDDDDVSLFFENNSKDRSILEPVVTSGFPSSIHHLARNYKNSPNCTKLDASAILNNDHDDDDDVSWFFTDSFMYDGTIPDLESINSPQPANLFMQNCPNSAYTPKLSPEIGNELDKEDDKDKKYNIDYHTQKLHSGTTSDLCEKMNKFSLHVNEEDNQKHAKPGAQNQDDIIDMFSEDDEIERMYAIPSHHRKRISDTTHEGQGTSLDTKDLQATVTEVTRKTFKTNSFMPQLDEGNAVKHKDNAPKMIDATKNLHVQNNNNLDLLQKCEIVLKPSNILQGSAYGRILSRHFARERDICGSPVVKGKPLRASKPKLVSCIGQSNMNTAMNPMLTVTETSHMQSTGVEKKNSQPFHQEFNSGITVEKTRTDEFTIKAEKSFPLASLGYSLSHGAVPEMKLVIEASQAQLTAKPDHQKLLFDPDLVHVQTLAGPPSSSSCCVQGLVIPIEDNRLNTLRIITGRSLAAVLLNSDLHESSRHSGFKNSLKSSTMVRESFTPTETSSSIWEKRIISSLKEMNINMVLVRGSVDSSLVEASCSHDILILEHVPYRLLELLATVCNSSILTYIPDALQDEVCENIQVSYWSCGHGPQPTVRSSDVKIKHHMRLLCQKGEVVQTIVFCAPTSPHLAGAVDHLHSCMARLRGALHDGKVLCGGDWIERHLVERLTQENGSGKHKDYHNYHHSLIYQSLAHGFKSFIQQTQFNMGQHHLTGDAPQDTTCCYSNPSSPIHDCFSSKIGAWQRAWYLVKQVLLCDSLIVTGASQGDEHLERIL